MIAGIDIENESRDPDHAPFCYSFTCHSHVHPQNEMSHAFLYFPAAEIHSTFGWY